MKKYGVRELSRFANVDTKTVMKYLHIYTNRGILLKQKEKGKFPYYEANRISLSYRHAKSEIIIQKIIESGLVEYLEKELSPEAIVLFGSIQKGTYHSESDVDIFVQGNYKRLDLSKFQKKIGHEIRLLFENELRNLSKGLLENIYNGMVLAGKIGVVS